MRNMRNKELQVEKHCSKGTNVVYLKLQSKCFSTVRRRRKRRIAAHTHSPTHPSHDPNPSPRVIFISTSFAQGTWLLLPLNLFSLDSQGLECFSLSLSLSHTHTYTYSLFYTHTDTLTLSLLHIHTLSLTHTTHTHFISLALNR